MGLQQVLWFNSSISLTLDTVSIYVTTYNGSNATAVTRTSTRYGDISTIKGVKVPEAYSIYMKWVFGQIPEYDGGGSVFLARGTDGGLGSITSIAWPTAYVLISSVAYYTTVRNTYCPSGLQPEGSDGNVCGCALNGTFTQSTLEDQLDHGINLTYIGLPSLFYFPLDPTIVNFNSFESGFGSTLAQFNVSTLSSWLREQPWATSLVPNLAQCVVTGVPQGPPGIKIPVAALTTTATTTVDGGSPPTHSSAKPASSQTQPGPTPTSVQGWSTAIDPSPSSSSYPVIGSGEATPSTRVGPGPPGVASMSTDAEGPSSSGSTSRKDDSGGSPSHPLETASVVSTRPAAVSSETITQSLPAGPSRNGEGSKPSVKSPVASDSSQNPPVPLSAPLQGTPSPSDFETKITPEPIATVAGHTIDSSPEDSNIVVVHGVTPSLRAHDISTPDTDNSGGSAVEVWGGHPGSSMTKGALAATGPPVASTPLPVIALDQIITPNAQAITISGTVISLGSSGLVIGTSTVPISVHTSAPQPVTSTITYNAVAEQTSAVAITMNGKTLTVESNAVVVGGVTVSQGAPATTVSGTGVSLGTADIIIGGSTIRYEPGAPQQSAVAITMDGEVLTVGPSAVVAGSITISEGAPPITIGGTAISLGSADLIVGASTLEYSQRVLQSTEGVGAAIIQALGRSDSTATATAKLTSTANINGSVATPSHLQPFTGGGAKGDPSARLVVELAIVGSCIIVLAII